MRRHELLRGALVMAMVFCLAQLPWLDVAAGAVVLGKVAPRGSVALNRTPLVAETTVYSGDTVTTSAGAGAVVYLSEGSQLQLGPTSEVRLSQSQNALAASLERGSLLVRSGGVPSLTVLARGLLLSPEGTARFQVAVVGGSVLVASEQGTVEVRGTNQAYTVTPGRTMRFETMAGPQAPAGAGPGGSGIAPGAAAAIAIAVSVGVSVPVAIVVANNKAGDACQAAIHAVSPSASTAGCP